MAAERPSPLGREESRGAHQRDDFPATDPALARRQHPDDRHQRPGLLTSAMPPDCASAVARERPVHYDEFRPFEDGASVLDALIGIRGTSDPSLAFRYSCISANVCKECTIAIDGVVDYACTMRLRPGP
jgi:hypothetical protein